MPLGTIHLVFTLKVEEAGHTLRVVNIFGTNFLVWVWKVLSTHSGYISNCLRWLY